MGIFSNQTKHPFYMLHSLDQCFPFYISVEHYFGIPDTSLEEFVNAFRYTCSESIIFNFDRGALQNQISNLMDNAELAKRLDEKDMLVSTRRRGLQK